MLAAILGSAAAIVAVLITQHASSNRRAGRIEEGVAGLYRYIDSKLEDLNHRVDRLETWQDRMRNRRSV